MRAERRLIAAASEAAGLDEETTSKVVDQFLLALHRAFVEYSGMNGDYIGEELHWQVSPMAFFHLHGVLTEVQGRYDAEASWDEYLCRLRSKRSWMRYRNQMVGWVPRDGAPILERETEIGRVERDGAITVVFVAECDWDGGEWRVVNTYEEETGEGIGDPGLYCFSGEDEDVPWRFLEGAVNEMAAGGSFIHGRRYHAEAKLISGGSQLGWASWHFTYSAGMPELRLTERSPAS